MTYSRPWSSRRSNRTPLCRSHVRQLLRPTPAASRDPAAGLVPDTVISVSVSRDVSPDLYYVTLTASRRRDQACKCHLVRLNLLCFSHVAVANATRPPSVPTSHCPLCDIAKQLKFFGICCYLLKGWKYNSSFTD